ncbi:hypothetical protein NA57DRAFT_50419 [Rhizodiscina lignyota]|uniref:Fungal-specific transcription factor domain-containing protein n=1 Tax=Rhizodiscina lignyota TaxID=1504668 RepID=A0A9P4I4N9_9PEZI|nr:hypothetical protein NA57DRAFT_50419 [Rhizodiscina lignyota]
MVCITPILNRHITSNLTYLSAWAYYNPKPYSCFWFPHQPYNSMARLDPFLTVNSRSPIARLISSSHDADNLYGLLVRLSFNDNEPPSLATRHAISALSYQHLSMERTAIMHRTSAIRALQNAIGYLEPSQIIQTTAASMLLSVAEILNYEASIPSWYIFFCGTKNLLRQATQKGGTCTEDGALIMDWIFYHDAMYMFSVRHWGHKRGHQKKISRWKTMMSKATSASESHVVVPTIGCSLELLNLLCEVVHAILDREDPSYHSQAHLKRIRALEIRLRGLEQCPDGVSGIEPEEKAHRSNIAELFRLATLTYLYRVAKGESRESIDANTIIERAFALLRNVKNCERPWSLFIIALEARTEHHRAIVLEILKESLRMQPVGMIALTKRMIHDAWVQQDLHDEEIDPLTLYGLIISRSRVPPCFA